MRTLLNPYRFVAGPLAPPTPEFWLRSDFEVELGGIPATNGGTLDFWGDMTGNGWDAIQGTAAQRPIYNTNVINGLPAINFPATTNQLLRILLTDAIMPNAVSTFSFFAVVRPADFTAAQILLNRSSGLGFFQWYLPTTGRQIFSNGTESSPSNTSLAAAAWNRIGMKLDWSVGPMDYYLDGVADGSPAAGVTGAFSDDPTTLYLFGSSPSFVFPFKGDVAEVLFYTRIVTPAEVATIDAYFADRYGL